LKTKKKSDARFTVQMIGFDSVAFERVRASLRGSPFHFSLVGSPDNLPADPPDLFVAHVKDLNEISTTATPVIACGSAGLLRSAFLSGCADYLREPWLPEELELRALAALSRVSRRFEFPWGTVCFEGKDLRTPAGLVPLTFGESRLLRLLLRARGEPVPRAAIAYELWGNPARAAGRAVDVHAASIRKKVRNVESRAGRFITCVRGQGYMVP